MRELDNDSRRFFSTELEPASFMHRPILLSESQLILVWLQTPNLRLNSSTHQTIHKIVVKVPLFRAISYDRYPSAKQHTTYYSRYDKVGF